MSKKKESTFSLEETLQKLRGIVDEMQQGRGDFDKNVALFKAGSALIQDSRAYLDESELLLRKLVDGESGPEETTVD